MQSYAPNPNCCRADHPSLLCSNCKALHKRNEQERRYNSRDNLTENSRDLVINAGIPHRWGRESRPLIPPTMADILGLDSVVANQSVESDYSSMLPPPRTMEIVVNERRAEMSASRQRNDSSFVSPRDTSGPLIPPKLW